MFRTFRNFPRINDKGNVVSQPLVKTFVADGIGDQSKGVWISPTRTTTTDDGTLHIGLMNPFEGASVTIPTGFCDEADTTSPPCVAACDDCNCFAARLLQNQEDGVGFWTGHRCVYDVDNGQPGEGEGTATCNMRCVLSRPGSGGPLGQDQTLIVDCVGNPQYTCGSGVSFIPDIESQILRAIERFVLEMDLGGLAGVSAGSINSATLRLPIKKKSDWM
jgi:hypothetical protein